MNFILTPKSKMVDVDKKVIKQMIVMINKCEQQARLIIRDDFKRYCMRCFLLPKTTIDRCIPQAFKQSHYELK